MAGGYHVDVEQLRAHARNLEAIRERLAAVNAAGAGITQDDQVYGRLCGWIAGVLENRRVRQSELLAQAVENLARAAQGLRATADEYEELEHTNTGLIRSAGGEGTA